MKMGEDKNSPSIFLSDLVFENYVNTALHYFCNKN